MASSLRAQTGPSTGTSARDSHGSDGALEHQIAGLPSAQDDLDARRWQASVANRLFGSDLAPPQIGRYEVRRRVGAGGLGIVYEAYDPALERTVAIKLLRDGVGSRLSLEQEAISMARVSHRNVVQVFDVGRHAEEVFVAMEFVDGVPLRQYLRERRLAARDVVALFVSAGRGLAAVHACGLVHADFKSDNVLIDADGRVRVSDFGLARRHDPTAPSVDAEPVAGTRKYMAPEQLRGGAPDARSDQYSFCVALREALEGTGTLAKRPSARIQDALQRGLSEKAEDRFPNVDALLRRLQPARRGRLALGGALITLTGAVVALVAFWPDREGDCANPTAVASSIWNSSRATQLVDAFAESHVEHAHFSATRTVTALDEYTDEWTRRFTEACSANGETGGLRQQLCLQSRLQETSLLVDRFVDPDVQTIHAASDLMATLPDPAICRQGEAVSSRDPLLRDPAVQLSIAALWEELVAVRALRDTAPTPGTREAARRIAENAALLGYRPLQAEAHLVHGQIEMRAADSTLARSALELAVVAGDAADRPDVQAEAAIGLMWLALGDDDRFPRWRAQAQAALDSLGDAPELRALLVARTGSHLKAMGKADEAREMYLRAVALSQGTAKHYVALTSLGKLMFEQGDLDGAQSQYSRALAHTREFFGAGHPRSGDTHGNLGEVAFVRGALDDALFHFEAALASRRTAYGDDSFWTAHTHGHIGDILLQRGALHLARARYERMLNMSPENAVNSQWAHAGLAQVALNQGDVQEAQEHAMRISTDIELGRGGHADRASRVDMLGWVLLAQGDASAAVDRFRTAVDSLEPAGRQRE